MPRPTLPSNNSKYWGADLNNYLLSLQSQLDQLQKIHSEDSSFDVTVFKEVGFARDYSLTITNEANWESNINGAFVSKSQEPDEGLQLSGTVYLQSATGDSITTRKIAVDLDIFSTDINRKNGSISSDGQIALSESFSLSQSFYNVYYYLDVTDDDAKPVIIFSQDTLANLSMIMIGTLDYTSAKPIFIPRSFSNTKGITQSLKDCLEPRISVIDDPFINKTKPPFLGTYIISGEDTRPCSYWMFINGIQPSLSNTGGTEPSTQSFDSKILYVDNTQIYIWNNSNITAANNNDSFTESQYDFYLSISGKVFAQPHAENAQFTDYIVQSTEDLRFYDVFKAGGLVYIGTYYPDSSYPKFCIAQSGGVPPILNATHYDWNKVLIEEKEFYSKGNNINNLILHHGTDIAYYNLDTTGIVQSIEILYDFTGAMSDNISSIFWGSWYTNIECTTNASLPFSKGTYYFKASKSLLYNLKQYSENGYDQHNIGDMYITWKYDLQSKFTVDIHPHKNNLMQTTIHLNMPNSSQLMIPLFDNNQVSTTTNTLTIPNITTQQILGSNDLKIESQNLDLIVDSDFTCESGEVSVNSSLLSVTGSNAYVDVSYINVKHNVLSINGPTINITNSSSSDWVRTFWSYMRANSGSLTNGENYLQIDESGHISNLPSGTFITFSVSSSDIADFCSLFVGVPVNTAISLLTYYTTPLLVVTRINENQLSFSSLSASEIFTQGTFLLDGTGSYYIQFKISTPSATIGKFDLTPTVYINAPYLDFNGELLCHSSVSISDTNGTGGQFKIGQSTIITENTLTNGKVNFDADGNITCTSTIYTSDRRYKTNIKPISTSSCLEAIKNLQVHTYSYIDSGKETLGIIAQDIEQYLPEYADRLVHEDENGKKYVEEHKLLFILWQAVKELIAKQKD